MGYNGAVMSVRSTTWLPRHLVFALLLAAVLVPPARAATSTARYTVRFDSIWSAATHPVDYPPGAHYSPLIGTVHNDGVLFWQQGQLASEGIERMAEQGRSQPFDQEVAAAVAAGNAREFLEVPGFRSPGAITLDFTIEAAKPFVTLVAMLAPSPDWFVGVSGLPLMENGDWVAEKRVTLWPWDAGTDSGTTYAAENRDTNPAQPIRRITILPIGNGVPVGTFTFTRTDTPPPPPLELQGGRFEVEVRWQTPDGTGGYGTAQALSSDTGVFWFFRPTNIELVVKVLDACAGFDRFWVFAGGLTDVEVEIRVRDTASGQERTYTSPLGTAFEPLQDTRAFATCP